MANKKSKNHSVIIIPRRFRWTLSSDQHPGIEIWFYEVNLDMANHVLHIKVIENQTLDVFNWVKDICPKWGRSEKERNLIDSPLKLTTYTGNSNPIYSLIFNELEVIKHYCPYNYTDSKEVSHELSIRFRKVEKVVHIPSSNK